MKGKSAPRSAPRSEPRSVTGPDTDESEIGAPKQVDLCTKSVGMSHEADTDREAGAKNERTKPTAVDAIPPQFEKIDSNLPTELMINGTVSDRSVRDRSARKEDETSPSDIPDHSLDQLEEPTEVRSLKSTYKLLGKIGEGGLGCVWLARDERLKRKVAIKQLRGDAANNPHLRARFHREAEITGLLEHPNIVPLHQFGLDDEEPLYVMRFVGKRTLLDAIAEHRDLVHAGGAPELGLHRLLTAFLGVGQAIAHAHSRGVIHRDLKPENIALDNFGQVVVLDWGLAKLADDSELATQLSHQAMLGDTALAFTTHGDVVGTPLYMAPEQALGDLDIIDKKTDIYGLGAILFAILTGTAPHQEAMRKCKTETTSGEMLSYISTHACPRPRDIDPTVPPELDDICARAMALKQHLRYSTVGQMSEAVERWMVGQGSKQKRYDALRGEGRELVRGMRSMVESLERSVEFMSNLPPIQELVRTESEEDQTTWCERLATILTGLIAANREYRTALFLQIEGDRIKEVVRVERHGNTHSRIRKVPRSRLRQFESNGFLQRVSEEKPDEIVTGIEADLLCEIPEGNVHHKDRRISLVSGVPIYDRLTEEPYGVLAIDCDIERFIQNQYKREWDAKEVVFYCASLDMAYPLKTQRTSSSLQQFSTLADCLSDDWYTNPVKALQEHEEYIDETDGNVYGVSYLLRNTDQNLSYILQN